MHDSISEIDVYSAEYDVCTIVWPGHVRHWSIYRLTGK